jgi:hypothetical protein
MLCALCWLSVVKQLSIIRGINNIKLILTVTAPPKKKIHKITAKNKKNSKCQTSEHQAITKLE